MNILLINYEYPPTGGGASNATYYIAESLVKLGHNVTVITSAFKKLKGFSSEKGVNIYRIPSMRARLDRSNIFEMAAFVLSAFLSSIQIVQKEKINGVISFFSIPCGPIALYIKNKMRINYIISLRGGDVPGTEKELGLIYFLLSPIRRNVLKNAAAIVANSDGLKLKSEIADPFEVRVIPNGVDTDFYCPSERKPDKIFNFLFVGRFHKQKNLLFLLNSIKKVNLKGTPSFMLTLIGGGPLKAKIEAFIIQNGLSNSVFVLDWKTKDELRNEYQKADCFINPSVYEGMPNAVLEAMSCGLPIIASNIEGNNELVKNGKNGLLFDLDKPEEMLEKLTAFLFDRKKAAEMGRVSRDIAVKNFSWKYTASQYAGIFRGGVNG